MAHVIPVMDPSTGGPPPVVGALCALMRQAGTDASVICYETWPGDGGADRTKQMMSAIPGGRDVPIAYLPALTKTEVRTAAHARRLLPDQLRGADLIHLHGVWDPVILTASKAARQLGIPYVLSTHGMLEPWAVRKRWKKEIAWRLGWGSMLQRATAIHDYRPGPIQVLGRELKPKVWEIANGIFGGNVDVPGRVAPAWRQLCVRFPQLEGKRIVLFMSRVAHQKGVDLLLTMLPGIRGTDICLVIAGPDYGGISEGHRRFISVQEVPDNLAIVGPLFGEEKAAALAHASVFVLPSRHEGFSVAVLEAMHHGLPCVITSACHFPRAGEAGAAVVCEVRGFDGLETHVDDAVRKLLGTPEEMKAMGQRAKALVEREYTWQSIVPKYLDMYESVVPGEWRPPEHAPADGDADGAQPPTWGAEGPL